MANILLFDDSADLLEMFQFILQANGYETITTDTKKQFEQELLNKRPDLILIDIHLRDADGREVCKAIKENPETKNIPVILMSANSEKLGLSEGYLADEILEKPFDISVLKSKIESLVKGK